MSGGHHLATVIPNDPRVIEAVHRLSLTPDGKMLIEHLSNVLTGLDVGSRRLVGDQALLMNGRRIQLEEVLTLFDNIAKVANQKKQELLAAQARSRQDFHP